MHLTDVAGDVATNPDVLAAIKGRAAEVNPELIAAVDQVAATNDVLRSKLNEVRAMPGIGLPLVTAPTFVSVVTPSPGQSIGGDQVPAPSITTVLPNATEIARQYRMADAEVVATRAKLREKVLRAIAIGDKLGSQVLNAEQAKQLQELKDEFAKISAINPLPPPTSTIPTSPVAKDFSDEVVGIKTDLPILKAQLGKVLPLIDTLLTSPSANRGGVLTKKKDEYNKLLAEVNKYL
jgi:hypothetical protein